MALGLGWMLHGLTHAQECSFVDGRKMVVASSVGFGMAAAFFGLVINISGLRASVDVPWSLLVPLALIATGPGLVLRKMRVGFSEYGKNCPYNPK